MRDLIQVRVSQHEKRRLKEVAARNNKTLSDFMRDAINEIVADSEDGPPILKLRKNAA